MFAKTLGEHFFFSEVLRLRNVEVEDGLPQGLILRLDELRNFVFILSAKAHSFPGERIIAVELTSSIFRRMRRNLSFIWSLIPTIIFAANSDPLSGNCQALTEPCRRDGRATFLVCD
jgi:hypothetical protein